MKQLSYLNFWLVKEIQSAVLAHNLYFSFDSYIMSLIVLYGPTYIQGASNALELVISIKFTVDASTVHIPK
jgi:hypothetical protein